MPTAIAGRSVGAVEPKPKSSATSSKAATMMKKLNDKNSTLKGVVPLDAAPAQRPTGR